MTGLAFILAQPDDGFSFIYVAIVLLSMVGGLGKWIRDRSAGSREGEEEEENEQTTDDTAIPEPPFAAPAQPRGASHLERMTEASPREALADFLRKAAEVRQRVIVPHPQRRPVPPPVPPTQRARPARARSRQEEVQAVEALIEKRRGRKKSAPPPASAQAVEDGFTNLTIAELRRAIVLNEVLGPPIALRDKQASR